MKHCNICNRDLDESNFSKKGDGLQSSCKDCHAAYRKQHYEKNKTKYVKKANYWRKNFMQWVDSLKETLKCSKCGESRWWVLDFHHRDKNSKISEISKLRYLGNKQKVLDEIQKCDVLCANCHRDLHYHEFAGNA